MPIEIKVNASTRIRQLARDQGLSVEDIHELTDYSVDSIRAALGWGEARDKPKSKSIEASGSLSAEQVAKKLRIPVAHARRVTG